MRPIDADALKKDLTRFYDNEVTAKRLIDEQPTIEPDTDTVSRQKMINTVNNLRTRCDNDIDAYHDLMVAAIDALPPSPSRPIVTDSDTISRQDAINLIERYCDNGCEIAEDKWCPDCQQSQFAKMIKALPPSQSRPQWIPCSERLPDEYGEYRITWVTSLVPSKRFIGDSEYEVTSVWDEERKGFKGEWLLDDYIKNYPDVKVIAWKLLEEPYREGE